MEARIVSGESFRVWRLRHRISQFTVAKLSGVPPYRISAYENEAYIPTRTEQRLLRAVVDKLNELHPLPPIELQPGTVGK